MSLMSVMPSPLHVAFDVSVGHRTAREWTKELTFPGTRGRHVPAGLLANRTQPEEEENCLLSTQRQPVDHSRDRFPIRCRVQYQLGVAHRSQNSHGAGIGRSINLCGNVGMPVGVALTARGPAADLSRTQEAWRATGDATVSVATGLASTARVITSAALIMVRVFTAFIPRPPFSSPRPPSWSRCWP